MPHPVLPPPLLVLVLSLLAPHPVLLPPLQLLLLPLLLAFLILCLCAALC